MSDDGKVWSHRAKRLLVPKPDKWGYLRVTLSNNRQRKTVYVHTLVATAFVGEKPVGLQCRHLNGDPLDNRAANLAWGTCFENQLDKKEHGTIACGERSGLAKLTEKAVLDIRSSALPRAKLAKMYGITPENIYYILKRKTWAHVP